MSNNATRPAANRVCETQRAGSEYSRSKCYQKNLTTSALVANEPFLDHGRDGTVTLYDRDSMDPCCTKDATKDRKVIINLPSYIIHSHKLSKTNRCDVTKEYNIQLRNPENEDLFVEDHQVLLQIMSQYVYYRKLCIWIKEELQKKRLELLEAARKALIDARNEEDCVCVQPAEKAPCSQNEQFVPCPAKTKKSPKNTCSKSSCCKKDKKTPRASFGSYSAHSSRSSSQYSIGSCREPRRRRKCSNDKLCKKPSSHVRKTRRCSDTDMVPCKSRSPPCQKSKCTKSRSKSRCNKARPGKSRKKSKCKSSESREACCYAPPNCPPPCAKETTRCRKREKKCTIL